MMTPEQCAWFADTFEVMAANVGQAILGKKHVISLALTTMLAEGHLLLEDAPGTGKTSLAKALAASAQGTHNRIQFTPDLLPSDVVGVTIYDQSTNGFQFHEGPVFANIVLADEINRASPKTQSALLEVMEEGHVTVDGVTHRVPEPFMVIATQNPIEQSGTYRLPEAQLDRFLMKTSLGYPEYAAAMEVLAGSATKDRTANLSPVITTAAVGQMSKVAASVHVDEAILDYVLRICSATREDPQVSLGVSMRGGLALVRAAKVWAIAHRRPYVTPDDVKVLAPPVLGHRLLIDTDAEFTGATAPGILTKIIADTVPPAERIAV